jgi:hypothetical protein
VIRTQGLYKRNRLRDARPEARAALRAKLGIPAQARIVLGVGYADARKGADLFVRIGELLMRRDPDLHFAWLGHHDATLQPKLRAMVDASGLGERFHFPGRDPDTDVWYAGADLYALTSREDPFPTTIMEAMDAGLPVVGFAGVGGFDALLPRAGGRLVPALDVEAFAQACAALLGDAEALAQASALGRALVESEYDFATYVRELVGLLGEAPRVSVVVPNYNYAHYLPQRLASIFEQTHAPYEVIVLDDASTDDSLAVLEQLAKRYPIRIVASEGNSGSVFRQWQRGVLEARGELVWIAEADDLAEPGFLEGLLPALRRADVVMSYCQSRQIDADGETIEPDYLGYVADFGAARWQRPFVAELGEELQHGLAVKNTIPNVSAVLFRRTALAQMLAQHLEEIAACRVAGDWLAYLRVLERGALAFNPEVLNRHRRHRAGVTLGGDARRHYEEVARVQALAASRYEVDAATRAQAQRYLEFLAGYLGLAAREA